MKKVLSLLLAVMMVISLCPITALADEANPIELQQVETQEEQPEQPAEEQPAEEQSVEEQPEEPQQGGMNTLDLLDGSEAAPLAEGGTMTISSAAEFVAFRDAVNAGETSKDAKLVADIDLSTVCGEEIGSFTPIEKYSGTFDGDGHTISNLYLSDDTREIALFNTIEKGTVKNLGIVSATAKRSAASTYSMALLCNNSSGYI